MISVDEKMNITLTKGDNACLELTLMNGDEEYNYSQDTVKFVVKRSQQDSEVVLEKTVEDSKINLTPEDTNSINGFGDFLYAIKVYHEAEESVEAEEVVESEEIVAKAADEPVIEVYTPIIARFTLGFNIVA